MRILIITDTCGSMDGWERYSQGLVGGLAENGAEVFIICHKRNPEISYPQYEILPAHLSFKKNYFLSWYYALKIVWALRKHRFDAVHCFVESYSFMAMFVSLFSGTRYFLTVHGTFAIKFFSHKIYGPLQRFAYRNCAGIVSVSRYTKERLLSLQNGLRVGVIPNGISGNFLERAAVNKSQTQLPAIVSVGELKSRKGFEYLLHAVALVRQEIPEATCTIVGSQKDSVYFSFLCELQKELRLETAVTFLEKISDDRLLDVYKNSKVFVLPSVSDGANFEGFGLVYIEANAFGLPAIGSKESGAEDAILDGKTGFLARQKDPEDIAAKILQILQNENLRESMAKEGIIWSKELSWRKIAVRYIDLYNGHTQ